MNFEFYSAGKIIFGRNSFKNIGEIASRLGDNFLVVLGGGSVKKTGALSILENQFRKYNIKYCFYEGVVEEPCVSTVDEGVKYALNNKCNGIISIGGGSVIDAGKAVAGMAVNEGSIMDYLEGVGKGRNIKNHPLPFIAVPTTSGTGTEVTKNAVIMSTEMKFKRSFRDERLIPDVALVDPVLTITLSPEQTASSGLDALTQLVEAYVSKKSQPISDALAIYGIDLAGKWLRRAYIDGQWEEARTCMSLASLLSGLCLANAGLGAAHGIAASLGANYQIPHGIACAVLLPHIMEINMGAQLHKFAKIGRILSDREIEDDTDAAREALGLISKLVEELGIPADLKAFGLKHGDINDIIKGCSSSSMSGNPVTLSHEQLRGLLQKLCAAE